MSDVNPAVAALVSALQALGVTGEDGTALLTENATATLPPRRMLTVAEYAPTVAAAAPPSSKRTYETYWRQLVEALGDQPIDEVMTSQLAAVALAARKNAIERRNSRDGRSAGENCVGAMRYFFALAVSDKLRDDNPALAVPKPRRLPSPRHPLTDQQIRELWQVTASGGDDPLLDTLLVRLHLETGARRGGAIALRRRDLLHSGQQLRLHEKGGTVRLQPVSATLLQALTEHADARGATDPGDAVLRYRPKRGGQQGAPLTRRRYNTLANRWQKNLKWAAEYGVSPHWLRHTAIATVQRVSGFGVARAFAGHTSPSDTTTTYITASPEEVARAVSALTGETHPLVAGSPS
jgi:integrase